MNGNNIECIVNSGLCAGCGTCVSLCPKKAVNMNHDKEKGIFLPTIDKRCNLCKVCLKICPKAPEDLEKLNYSTFGEVSKSKMVGFYSKSYVGFSKEEQIRFNSSSGGLITQILASALEKGIIDGALVVKMDENSPSEPKPFIAKTREQIIQASQSKYCPVPINIVLEHILNTNGKYAIVGLPCQILGIRKAQLVKKELNDKIVFCLGLFCNHVPNSNATDLLLKRNNIKKDEITLFNYRSNGWPGSMKIITKNDNLNISQGNSWKFIGSYFFYPRSCISCNDVFCELADASFGDAWLSEYFGDNRGTSIVIVRSNKMEDVIKLVGNDLELKEINVNDVIRSQSVLLYLKKKILPSNDIFNNLLSKYIYFNSYLSSTNWGKKLLVNIPLKMIWLYGLPYNILIRKLSKNYWKKKLK